MMKLFFSLSAFILLSGCSTLVTHVGYTVDELTTDEPGNYNGNYFCMKPSPCGRLYVAGGFFAQIKIFDCKDNREMANINIGKNICFDLSLSSEYLFY